MTILTKKTLIALSTSFVLSACSATNSATDNVADNSTNNALAEKPQNASSTITWPTNNVEFCSAALDKAAEQLDGFRKTYTNPN